MVPIELDLGKLLHDHEHIANVVMLRVWNQGTGFWSAMTGTGGGLGSLWWSWSWDLTWFIIFATDQKILDRHSSISNIDSAFKWLFETQSCNILSLWKSGSILWSILFRLLEVDTTVVG